MPKAFAALIDEIEQEPKVGDIRLGREIGRPKQHDSKFIWAACGVCRKERWTRFLHQKPQFARCIDCGQASKAGKPNLYRGGRTTTKQGYILLYKPGHHRASTGNYVMEHIYIWEKVHNRKLPDGYLVHHLNGIKGDNRPDNLVAMRKGEHVHQAGPFKLRIRALEMRIALLEKALLDGQMVFNITEN